MRWTVIQHDDFEPEFAGLPQAVRDELLAAQLEIEVVGPFQGRPLVDTLNGSKHANMKEIRIKADNGVWRFAFAFDPKRQAVVLCGGDKSGGSETRFYKRLISKADERFDHWLKQGARNGSHH